MKPKVDKNGREIRTGDFILVRPTSVFKYDESIHTKGKVVGRAQVLKEFHEFGIVQWPGPPDLDTCSGPPIPLQDYFIYAEAEVLLTRDGKKPI